MHRTAFAGLGIGLFTFMITSSMRAADAQPRLPQRVPVVVRLQLEKPADLKAEDVGFSIFPGGRRCAFTYKGASQPATIRAFTDIGFRTTIHASPGTSSKHLRALEQAGAEIAVGGYWGARGNYGSMIGANTVQEAYDAVTTSRIALLGKCDGPVPCGAVSGHINHEIFPFNRSVESGAGFGGVFHDSHFLQTNEAGQDGPYAVLLGRHRAHPSVRVTMRQRFNNTMRAKNVPNEKVYYQMLAHQFLGTLRRVRKGQIIQYSLRDFKPKDIAAVRRILGKYGTHPLIWHATEGMIAANEYQKRKVHVERVTADGAEVAITLGLEGDLFTPYLLAPLSLELPEGLGIRSARIAGLDCTVGKAEGALHVQVPLQASLRDGVTMTLKTAAPDMTVPDEMKGTLVVRNTSNEPLEDTRLRLVGSPGLNGSAGLTVTGSTDRPLTVAPGQEVTVPVEVRTARGAFFGISPVVAVLTGTRGGTERLFMEGFQVTVAPMLRVSVCPYQQIPLPKGRWQHVIVRLDNRKAAGGRPLFISRKAGPCKGEVGFDLPAGMTMTPSSLRFELKENGEAQLVFKLRNDVWSPDPVRVPPVIRLDGMREPVEVPYPGTRIIRNRAMLEYEPLDEQGLLAVATWDDKKFCGFDRAVGRRGVGHGGLANKIGVNWTPLAAGVKGWCIGAQSAVLADSFKNVDYKRGTILCWIRRDLAIRNENQYKADPATSWKMGVSNSNNRGETLWCVGSPSQRTRNSFSGITLRRYYGWGRKAGYLEAILQCMTGQLFYVQAPYENDRLMEWRHTAVVWDLEARCLELYVDGKLAGKADPSDEEWYGCPWDNGTRSRGGRAQGIQPISMDHGKRTWTMRDDFFIYNRPLTTAEIVANMKRASDGK
jgi:hypothetical protein